MAGPLLSCFRKRIVALWEDGLNVSELSRTLAAVGRKTSCTAVRMWVFRYQATSRLQDRHRSSRPSLIDADMAHYFESELERDDEVTSVEIQQLISRTYGVTISSATIWRYMPTSFEFNHSTRISFFLLPNTLNLVALSSLGLKFHHKVWVLVRGCPRVCDNCMWVPTSMKRRAAGSPQFRVTLFLITTVCKIY